MSDQDLRMREEDLVVADSEQLDEFKASMGDPSEVPEPVAKTAKAPGKSKKQVDDPQDSPTAVKPGKPAEASAGKGKTAKMPMGESKMSMIQAMVDRMNGMKKAELAGVFEDMLAAAEAKEISEEEVSEEAVEVVRAGHKITADDIDIQEDIKAVFSNDEELSEEFKEAATTIFEAAVVSKVNEQLEKYVVDIESELNEEKIKLEEEMSAKLDQYLDYVVENWMEENRLAVESGVKSELVDDFITGLKDLFNEHYIEIPDDKVDVVEELAARAEDLENRLDEEIKKNAAFNAQISEHARADLFAEACESLTETQKEKFKTLSEGIEFVNEETYVEKLETLKKSYFSESVESTASTSDFDDAEPLEEEAKEPRLEPEMSAYVNAISRSLKK